MMTPLGLSGSVQDAFNEENPEGSRTGGRTPSGTNNTKHVRRFLNKLIYIVLHSV